VSPILFVLSRCLSLLRTQVILCLPTPSPLTSLFEYNTWPLIPTLFTRTFRITRKILSRRGKQVPSTPQLYSKSVPTPYKGELVISNSTLKDEKCSFFPLLSRPVPRASPILPSQPFQSRLYHPDLSPHSVPPPKHSNPPSPPLLSPLEIPYYPCPISLLIVESYLPLSTPATAQPPFPFPFPFILFPPYYPPVSTPIKLPVPI